MFFSSTSANSMCDLSPPARFGAVFAAYTWNILEESFAARQRQSKTKETSKASKSGSRSEDGGFIGKDSTRTGSTQSMSPKTGSTKSASSKTDATKTGSVTFGSWVVKHDHNGVPYW